MGLLAICLKNPGFRLKDMFYLVFFNGAPRILFKIGFIYNVFSLLYEFNITCNNNAAYFSVNV